MNIEEAIKNLKELVSWKEQKIEVRNYEIVSIETLLTAYEKQQKEIEELKEYKHDVELTKIACCTAQNCEALNNCIKLGRELQNADKKWKDKIKQKIEEYEQDVKDFEEYWSKDPRKFKKEKSVDYYKLEALKELLEKE